jgi:tRNA (adenine22-N1)-methyltransferase
MDVNQGPLDRAREHIRAYRLEEQITTRLSDGLAQLAPGEADAVLIAGMGGMLTVRILKNGSDVLTQVRELVLQPQSDIREVRSDLAENGFVITDEDMVEEDGKFYPMMRAVPVGSQNADGNFTGSAKMRETGELAEQPNQRIPDELALLYGPKLLAERHPVLLRYLKREQELLERVSAKLQQETGDGARERLTEIQQVLAENARAQSWYGSED